MSERVADRIRTNAERLRLSHLAESAEQLVQRAERDQMGYLEFLDVVLEEVDIREGRRFRNALELSGLPHHEGLDEFDFAFQPQHHGRRHGPHPEGGRGQRTLRPQAPDLPETRGPRA